jgi:hypothetical protein
MMARKYLFYVFFTIIAHVYSIDAAEKSLKVDSTAVSVVFSPESPDDEEVRKKRTRDRMNVQKNVIRCAKFIEELTALSTKDLTPTSQQRAKALVANYNSFLTKPYINN